MANTAASALITRCLDNLARAGAGLTRSGTTLNSKGIDWLNAAMRKVAMAYDFEELYVTATASTVDGTKTYPFPDDYNTIFSIRLLDGTSSIKLKLVLPREFDKYHAYPEADSENRPIWYVPFGNNFELHPIPDAIYTMVARYATIPAVVTTTADLIDYAPLRDDIIVAGATAEGFKMYQMLTDAKFWEGEFVRLLKEQAVVDYSDADLVGRGFDSMGSQGLPGEYWNDPFVRI